MASLPSSATSHCTGRPKAAVPLPQRIDLRNGIAAQMSASALPSTSRAGAPLNTRRPVTYRPARCLPSAGLSRTTSEERETPSLSANACAALVGSPFLYAADSGGPTTSSSTSGCRAATSVTRIASRRGVPRAHTAPCEMRLSASFAFVRSGRAASAPSTNEAGSSSTPISRRRDEVGRSDMDGARG